MKADMISRLEELLQKPAGEVARDVLTLQKEYQKLWTAEFEKARQAFIDEGGKAREFSYDKSTEDKRIQILLDKFHELREEEDQRIQKEQTKNLLLKQDIIARISALSEISTNVGAAFKKLQELQTEWKEAGPVSPHKHKEVQAEYSKAIENFYYNLKIYRELQEHDLKKNLEHKSELLEKMKNISRVENIKEAERLIKVYRNEWDEIGPVPNEKWEELKGQYRQAMDEAYGKLKSHYQSLEETKELNLSAKKQLVEKAVKAASGKMENVADWNKATDELLAIQEAWKGTGRAGHKDNEAVWSEFRAVCDDFFTRKKEFFSIIHEKQDEIRKFKEDLIAKAESMQSNTEWQKATQDYIKLQDAWKKQYMLSEREESKLFFRFRKACNVFFDTKKAHFDAKHAALEGNVKLREDMILALKNFTLPENGKEAVEALKKFSAEWNAAGQAPGRERKRLNEDFYNLLDGWFDKLQLNKSEKQLLQFRNKIERLAMMENAQELLRREMDYIRKQCDEIQSNIHKYENNLGFFKNAKSDNPLFKDVNDKIEGEKQRLTDFQARKKLLSEELNKQRQTA